MKQSKGVLLWGPPGTGKTMLARAASNALAKLHGRQAVETGFLYVKGPELLNRWLGESEANIRRLFASAAEHFDQHRYPAVIFVDEADALLGRRGSMHPGFEGIDRTIVPQFLSEMDGMHESKAFVLLATNRPDILDPAVVRDQRIDRKVHVSRPTKADAEEIFDKLFSKKPSAKGLASFAASALFDEGHHLWNVTTDAKDVVPIYLGTIASGAMVTGIVERSAQRAIREKASEIEETHVTEAIAEVEDEQLRMSHDLNDFMDGLEGQPVSIEKAKQEKRTA